MIYLDRNESQYGPAPECFNSLKNVGVEQLSQYTRDYARGVKSRVSEKLADWIGVTEKNILLSYGCEGLLKYAVHEFLPHGGTLMIPDKSWWYYAEIAKEVKGTTCEYLITEGETSFHFDIDNMIDVYTSHKPDLVFIASPNNPTGNAMSHEDMKRICAEFKDAIIILDEAYWGFSTLDNANAKELVEHYDNVLIFRTFSKYFALAGIRMGYGICSDRFEKFSNYLTRYLGYSSILENVTLSALDNLDWYQEINKKFKDDMKLYHQTLARYDFIKIFASEANFLMIRLHRDMCKPLQEYLLSHEISVKFFTDDVFNHHMRLSLGTQKQNRFILNAMVIFADKVKSSPPHEDQKLSKMPADRSSIASYNSMTN